MSTITFAGESLRNWQTPGKTLTRAAKESELISENIHVARGSVVKQFPKTFQCYALTDSEMSTVEGLINEDYSTLVIDGVSFSNCYVYQISDISEVREPNGVWTYSIEFRQADVY